MKINNLMSSNARVIPILIALLVSLYNHVSGQDLKFRVATEQTVKFEMNNQITRKDFFSYIGNDEKKLTFYYKGRETSQKKIFGIHVPDYKMTSMTGYEYLLDDFISFPSILIKNKYSVYSIGVFDDKSDYGYQEIHLNYSGQDYVLDSIYNADKKIHSSFSSDEQYLLINTLNTLSDYYNPKQDDQILVYDLKNIDKGEIKKEDIPCTHCSDSYLVDDKLFFTMGRKDGYGNFSNKDIYMAPWGNLEDSIKIASNTNIKSISPDGNYILGTRFWDRQKNTDVILNVEQQKYQMLLGRDYAKYKAFYSEHEKKFAYDFEGYLIYVDFPENYPFDALKWKNEEIPDWTEEEFWKQYEHAPLPE